jgi:hypothetical protein
MTVREGMAMTIEGEVSLPPSSGRARSMSCFASGTADLPLTLSSTARTR